MAGINISENLKKVNRKIQSAIKRSEDKNKKVALVAVSKKQPSKKIQNAIDSGQLDFAENYIQEALEKIEFFDNQNIKWHFIGRLQSNKLKKIVGNFDLIHSLDNYSQAEAISKIAMEKSLRQKLLVQINIANELTKSGITADEAVPFIKKIATLPGLQICGLMGFPPLDISEQAKKIFFTEVKKLSLLVSRDLDLGEHPMSFLSMGTSHDYELAIESGSNMVRIGTEIFGPRE